MIAGDCFNRVRERGLLAIAAAGNGLMAQPMYPAAYPEVVAVTATDEAVHSD